jgi:endogenous inhibitor of DNA gyrase (YacG/DUF329 family)
MDTIRITADQVFSEYLAWLAHQPMSPALEWVLANPPGAEAAQRALSTRRLTHRFMVALYGPACGARATGANAPDWHSSCPKCPACKSHRHAGECSPPDPFFCSVCQQGEVATWMDEHARVCPGSGDRAGGRP